MSHGDYKCSKCGEKAFSKCVSQRSIFLENQSAALFSNLITVTEKPGNLPKEPNVKEFHITFRYLAETEREALENIVSWLQKPGVLNCVSCDHHWVLLSEKCGLGCCSRKEAV